MPLLNYTTKVSAEKSLQEIQKILVAHGATAVMTEFDGNGNAVLLNFKVKVDGRDLGFRLPCDWLAVQRVLKESRKVQPRYYADEQCLNIAWRILKDWVAAQMAIVETQMVTMDEVFLPYALLANNKTLYYHVKESNLLLPPPDGAR